MNLTCSYCQTPFTLGMAEKVAALKKMQAEDLHHYDAHCPRCGRANAVSRERLEMFTPGWEDAIKETVPESTPVPPTTSMTPLSPASGPTPPRMPSAPASVKTPAKPIAKKPAAGKPKKAAAKKPAKKVVKAKPKPKLKKAVKKTAAKKKSKRK